MTQTKSKSVAGDGSGRELNIDTKKAFLISPYIG